MNEDRRRTEQYAAERDATLRSWISSAVYPHSPVLRRALDESGLGRRGLRGVQDLERLPTTTLAELGDGRAAVLEPTVDSIRAYGPADERARLWLADALGRRPELAREHVDPAYRPVLWSVAGRADAPLFVASTSGDVDRLAALGRRALSVSGVRPDDRLLVLDPAGTSIGAWQLLAGAREAGVAVLHADVDTPVPDAAPSVLVGRAESLCRALAEGPPGTVRSLVVHDGSRPDDEQRAALDGSGLAWAEWWAPTGVRAAWVRCPGGVGFHTWPSDEVVEVLSGPDAADGAGELVWSAVGWHGSVWLRLRTGVTVQLDPGPCPRCGRTTPRVRPVATAQPAPPAPSPRRRRRREPVRAA